MVTGEVCRSLVEQGWANHPWAKTRIGSADRMAPSTRRWRRTRGSGRQLPVTQWLTIGPSTRPRRPAGRHGRRPCPHLSGQPRVDVGISSATMQNLRLEPTRNILAFANRLVEIVRGILGKSDLDATAAIVVPRLRVAIAFRPAPSCRHAPDRRARYATCRSPERTLRQGRTSLTISRC